MLPRPALQAPSNAERAHREVDQRPPEPQRPALTEPERERHGPACRVPPFASDGEQSPGFFDRQRLDLLIIEPGRPGDHCDIQCDVLALHSLTQGGAQGPVDVVHRASGQTRADHPSVKLLDVLSFELIDPVCS